MHKSKKIGENEKDPWNQEHGNQVDTKDGTGKKNQNSYRKNKK